ncbi:hypothetical protein HY29_12785 [Hyphomonas beringensis]|uniref:Uncharacterized protein n=1 Tax=Hyphomonas beringensis TaxID=1280946 RepID=A0A062UGZ9_9PROT|nr:hypothetical protein [Hyphomonas beringensis]KCZ55405.1 hypothetical protein HY29_12785 [Hyphomonas beringensis]
MISPEVSPRSDSIAGDKGSMRTRATPTMKLVTVLLAALLFLCLPAFLAMAGA